MADFWPQKINQSVAADSERCSSRKEDRITPALQVNASCHVLQLPEISGHEDFPLLPLHAYTLLQERSHSLMLCCEAATFLCIRPFCWALSHHNDVCTTVSPGWDDVSILMKPRAASRLCSGFLSEAFWGLTLRFSRILLFLLRHLDVLPRWSCCQRKVSVWRIDRIDSTSNLLNDARYHSWTLEWWLNVCSEVERSGAAAAGKKSLLMNSVLLAAVASRFGSNSLFPHLKSGECVIIALFSQRL